MRDKQQIANRFAELMRAKRLQYGWSYRELQRRTGIECSQLIRIESGEHCPRLDTMVKICEALTLQIKLPDLEMI